MITGATIKAWAKRPENKERAKALGLRLFQNQATPENIRSLPSLGDFEDKAQEWAITNPAKAKMLMMSLAPLFLG